ncbi:hypothetical protein Bhyg_13647 [Pseudolycoriella hygida]|uniref:Uncharacterized protein n=1 Tax=Pseudolycoriella hygida TaxID=35572 RepID=A0A9Q0MP06_9DIPT|nr:hypothetical protein Bhyg_13647 [Pseudolycoriella hygida]
MSLLQSQF